LAPIGSPAIRRSAASAGPDTPSARARRSGFCCFDQRLRPPEHGLDLAHLLFEMIEPQIAKLTHSAASTTRVAVI